MPEDDSTPGKGRIEAFSDGVIAIILTIMVLELHIPAAALANGGFRRGVLLPLAPKLASYAVSFVVVAIMWVNHYHLMHTVSRPARALVWYNNNLLFWMSLIPLVTSFWGDHPTAPVAVSAYGAVLAASAAAFTLFRSHLCAAEDTDPALIALHRVVLIKSATGTALYVLASVAAFLSIWISIAIFILIPAWFFFPNLKRKPGETG